SARSCKVWPGFIGQHRDNHGVTDTLLGEPEVFRCQHPIRAGEQESVCGAVMERISGFFTSQDGTPSQNARKERLSKRVLAHTSVENPSGVALQSALYSLEVLSENSPPFFGDLRLSSPSHWDPAGSEAAEQIFSEHIGAGSSTTDGANRGTLTELRVGAARSRGLGLLKLDAEPQLSAVSFLPSLEERFDRLQKAWRQQTAYGEGCSAFTLTLNSDAILMDELWRFLTVPTPTLLRQEIPGGPECYLQPRYFTRARVVSGWNSAQRLPKEDALAVARGSAFIYTTRAARDEILDWLCQLEDRGIGERKSEGFGQVIACHPFHSEVSRNDHGENLTHLHRRTDRPGNHPSPEVGSRRPRRRR
ncbi:MAG: type III-B CRISPR module-associated Cmr3 family protein, partial [Dehalococcoidia bacterium]